MVRHVYSRRAGVRSRWFLLLALVACACNIDFAFLCWLFSSLLWHVDSIRIQSDNDLDDDNDRAHIFSAHTLSCFFSSFSRKISYWVRLHTNTHTILWLLFWNCCENRYDQNEIERLTAKNDDFKFHSYEKKTAENKMYCLPAKQKPWNALKPRNIYL